MKYAFFKACTFLQICFRLCSLLVQRFRSKSFQPKTVEGTNQLNDCYPIERFRDNSGTLGCNFRKKTLKGT